MDAHDETLPLNTRKPLHIFCVLALIAFLMGAAQSFLAIEVRQFLSNSEVSGGRLLLGTLVWQSLTGLTASAVHFAGLALAVELIDRVRWSLLPDAERQEQRSRYIIAKVWRMANANV